MSLSVTVVCFVAAISSCVSDGASRMSNLQRVITYCSQRLPSTVCHLTLADLLYSTDELRQNIVTFVVELFDCLETTATSPSAGGCGGAANGDSFVTG